MHNTIEKLVDKFISDNRKNIINDIATLVAIPSVAGEPLADAPYGKDAKDAMLAILTMADHMGLETQNCENRLGWAEIKGKHADKYIATVTHVDVVPAGDGWRGNPFVMEQSDGYIIGRGVMDDKGPSVLCLYALKFLHENKIPLRYTVRSLFGTAEETGMKDVQYFLNNYQAPVFAFSPDADFPVCNGEKGIYQAVLKACRPSVNVISISGGTVINAIPDTAKAVVRTTRRNLELQPNVEINHFDNIVEIVAHGVSGHASKPEGTVNAIGVIVDYILRNRLADESEIEYLEFLNKLHSDTNGKMLNIDSEDKLFGKLTIVGGTIYSQNGYIYQTVDCRYPMSTNGKNVTEAITSTAKDCATIEILSDNKPFYIDAESPAIQACISAYNYVTGENKKPFTIGGGTYARDFPYAVSFGPEHGDRQKPEFAGDIHSANESANIQDFMEALKIYILALLKLQNLDL